MLDDDISEWEALDAAAEAEARQKKTEGGKAKAAPGAGEKTERPKFTFTHVADLVAKAPEFHIHKWVETEALGFIVGAPGSFKSFFALAMALCVASGTPFYGARVRQGTVFYIAAEGHNGLANRVDAWARKNGIDRSKVRVFTSDRGARFLDKVNAADVTAAIRELVAIHGPPSLIVVDTLARNLGPGDENATSDMNDFIAAMDDLRGNWPGCTIIVAHHTGWDAKRRGRGSSAAFGAMDFEYILERKDKFSPVCVINTKMKEAAERADEWFALEVIDLGFVDEDGEPVTSGVLMPAEVGNSGDAPAKLNKGTRLARDTFIEAAAAHGVFDPDTGFQGLNIEDWRTAFYTKHIGGKPGTERTAFNRGAAALMKAGVLTREGDVYSTANAEVKITIAMQRDKRDVT
ncbi:helicase RepA family protein [Altererythrobacter sp. KTW20L]|uniref:AAA family ATPase n=1 Tax=Altererythrobacter sp. KTW20L TaxID=2942210 RepID=UPI0020C0A022|nr:AAA family ATPase [Altererythrobacter sp. KTW20L]MCL6251117.1 helicase RepA family protein [Altererythrobacter sp. KTW20L]